MAEEAATLKPYYVELERAGCTTCSHGAMWDVVGPDGVAGGTTYGNKDAAEEVADLMNQAYAAALDHRAEDGWVAVTKVKSILVAHWLTEIVCNHETHTDQALCYCGWRGSVMANVGLAVGDWVNHVIAIHPPAEQDGWAAVTPETMPPKNQIVDIWVRNCGGYRLASMRWEWNGGTEGFWDWHFADENESREGESLQAYFGIEPSEVSHWRTIPAPPAVEEGRK